MAYQSLYRRYRSRRFSEVRGQDHVVKALRNAVREDRVGHAYLFSGPRGTGKTSTARILAKVLNCEHPLDGEPCGVCDSCLSVDAGTSYDVHELDAASNNGVDAMRDLIDKASLGTPGASKVYILDEVHMLSKAAEAALLKTLEEPPAHVVFVLATTDPQKISPTIKSRTQHFDFRLLPADVLTELVRDVVADADLEVTEDAVEAVVRQAAGSARDALSALDHVVAAGGVVVAAEPLDEIVEALADRDTARALGALAAAIEAGRDPRTLADQLVAQLRDAFLSLMAPDLVQLPDHAGVRVHAQAQRLGAAALVRALEVVGTTLVEFRHAPDPRVLLDVALVRLTNPDADASPAALLERIERLEKAVADGPPAAPRADGPAGRALLGAAKAQAPPTARQASVAAAAPTAAAGTAAQAERQAETAPATEAVPDGGTLTARAPQAAVSPAGAELEQIWSNEIQPALRPIARATFGAARVVAVPGEGLALALPNQAHRNRCEGFRADLEAALAERFGRAVPLELLVDGDAVLGARPDARSPATSDPAADPAALPSEEHVDIDELTDAPPDDNDPVARLTAAFPGAELVTDPGELPPRGARR